MSGQPEVVLPPSQTAWFLDQADNVLSASASHYDALQGDYNFTSSKMFKDPFHDHVIHKYLPRRAGAMIPDIQEEIQVAMDQTWGVDTKAWREIRIWENMLSIIPRPTNRMILGLPTCRNEEYLKNMSKFSERVLLCANFYLRIIPRFLRPILGPLVTIPNKRYWRNTTKYTLPIINERLANFKRKQEDPSFQWDEPNDYISWHINLATAEGRHDELIPDIISRRLLPIDFAAIHTTGVVVTNTLFDLLSSPSTPEWLEGLQEEAERVLAEEGGQWTKVGLTRCHRLDSAIRESIRISNFLTRTAVRKVMPKDGIENKAEGWRAPQGTLMGLDIHNVQHDPDIYPNPNTYDAFRFSRSTEEADASTVHKEVSGTKAARLLTTSDVFLAFSHGRHSCPGRFFASLEMKLMLAHMVMHYEFQPLKSRPSNIYLGRTVLPSMTTTIKVRRKEGTTGK